jgi:hypothetical protein
MGCSSRACASGGAWAKAVHLFGGLTGRYPRVSSASPDAPIPVGCQRLEGDAAVVSFAFTGNEAEAGPDDAILEWVDDAGMAESCGPSSCDARCPPGHACSVAFITHALVLSGGTCL